MDRATWTAVDNYLNGLLLPNDEVLEGVLADSSGAGLPPISIAPNQGMLLQLLARSKGAEAILEIGTLGGYSAIWLARSLPPGGRLTTIELEPERAHIAHQNLERAGLAEKVEIRVGNAARELPRLIDEGAGPFDLIFIDADKPQYTDYFRYALALSAPGTVIVADNVVRGGEVVNPESEDATVQGVRSFLAAVAEEPRVTAMGLQTVGSKGYDGFLLAVVN